MIPESFKFIPIYTLLPYMMAGCGNPKVTDHGDDRVLASVYDVELRYSEAKKAIGDKYTVEDSAEIFYEFTQSWIKEQTLIQQAKEILSESDKDKSDLIIRYYNDLLIFELQSKMLQQRLDTNVSEREIENYYQKNLQNFELKENIVRLQFLKFGNPVPDPDRLWNLFVAGDPDDLNGMQHLATLSGGTYFNGDSLWLTFTDILKEIPITTYNQENYLNNNKFIRINEHGYTYFVHILEFKVKNKVSPMEFERDRIKNTLVNKRKVELLQQIENEIVEEAYKNKKIKKF